MLIPFYYNICFFSIKNVINNIENRSAEIAYMINLHNDRKISDCALDKALNALQHTREEEHVD